MVVHRFAGEADIPALFAVWQASFAEDTPAQIRSFFSSVNLARECLVAEIDGAVVSMVFMLPAELKADKPLPLQYIYAAATLPPYRGRGLFGDLLKQALQIARENGAAASFLRPAQPSLVDYYARFGYQPFFYCDVAHGKAKPSLMTVREMNAEEYAKRREQRQPPLSVSWPSRFLENTMMVGDAYAVCEANGDTLFIQELFCENGQYRESCEALATHFGCERYECRLPAKQPTTSPFGLLCPLQPLCLKQDTVPYMGVALD